MIRTKTGWRSPCNVALLAGVLFVAGVDSAMADTMTKLYIVAGQSNAMGQASLNSELSTTLQMPQANVPTYYNGAWQSLQPGMGVTTSNFGPELTFGRDLAAAMPGETIGLIKYAVGATTIAEDWKPGATTATRGPQYIGLLQTIQNAIGALGSNATPEIVGVAWMQGESDAIEGFGAQYQTNLTNFITQLRTDLGTPHLKFGIAQILSCWDNSAIVRQAQANVALSMTDVKVFDTNDLTTGAFGHYDTAGELALGSRFATTMTPEPSSFALLALGAGSLGIWAERRRRQSSRRV
jgi:hypothetical protein